MALVASTDVVFGHPKLLIPSDSRHARKTGVLESHAVSHVLRERYDEGGEVGHQHTDGVCRGERTGRTEGFLQKTDDQPESNSGAISPPPMLKLS
jgi:hypothetical protein